MRVFFSQKWQAGTKSERLVTSTHLHGSLHCRPASDQLRLDEMAERRLLIC